MYQEIEIDLNTPCCMNCSKRDNCSRLTSVAEEAGLHFEHVSDFMATAHDCFE